MHPKSIISLGVILAPVTLAATTSTSTFSAPPPISTSTSYTSDSQFQSDLVTAHNFYRSEHNASALVWNETSTLRALSWVRACVFKHSGGPEGENLGAGYPNATAVVDGWGLEREKYDFTKPTGFTEDTGHFTQVVWKNTTSVGCARKACNGAENTQGWYVVCEYWPPGNDEGDNNQFFLDNVKPQTEGKDTDTVESGVTPSQSAPPQSTPTQNAACGNADLRWGAGMLVVAAVVASNVV